MKSKGKYFSAKNEACCLRMLRRQSIIEFKKDLLACMEKRFITVAWILPVAPQEIPNQLTGF